MIIHVDMDAFYASVEEREQPALKGRPVIVGGSAEGRGVVAAANYAARKFGIHSAMPTSQAMRLCPEVIQLPVQMELYSKVSQQIHEIFFRYTPEIEPLSLDEAFLDVTASLRLFGSVTDIGKRIQQDIQNELSLVASLGIAPSKFVAKIASDINKPNGFKEIKLDEVQDFLDPLPVSRLWGVGKVTNAEFERMGISTIKQVRLQQLDTMQYRFGKFGKHIWELANGIDHRQVVTDHQAKSISNETTFATDISNPPVLKAVLMDLTEQVMFRLRKQDFYCKTVQIKIRYANFKTITRSLTLKDASQSTQLIWDKVLSLLSHALENRQGSVRLLGVGVSGLCKSISLSKQQDLFSFDAEEQQTAIDRLADEIKSRFGNDTIQRGTGIKVK